MREVSGRVLGTYCGVATQLGVHAEDLLEGLPFTRDDLDARGRDVDWHDYVTVLERLERALGSSERLEALGERVIDPPYTQGARKLAAHFAGPRHLYWLTHRWWGPQAYRNIQMRYEPLPGGRLRLLCEIGEGYGDCPQHFRVVAGALRRLPCLLELPAALVQLEVGPGRATYWITPPPSLSFFARLRRASRIFFAPRAVFAELAAQQAQLVQSHRELSDAYEKIRESEERHRALTERALDLIAEISADGRLLYLSPSVTGTLGYEPEELLGVHLPDRIHPDDIPDAADAFAEVLGSGLGCRPVIRIQHRSGGWVWMECVGNRFHTSEGEVRVVAILRDVSERRDLEEERQRYAATLEREVERRTRALEKANRDLRHLQTRLLQAERLGATEKLAGSIAHAINNPLAALIGTAELALESAPDARMARMLELARRVQEVVAGMLDLCRQGTVQPRLEDVHGLLVDVRDQIYRRGELRGVHISLKIEAGLPPIAVDRALFNAALVCLAENGIEAMQEGGTLFLEAGLLADLDVMELRICDTGGGIPEELRERVFEPFFTTKGGGTGLGLAIARGVIQGHGGRLRIDDRPGGGTVVIVDVPIGEAGLRPGGAGSRSRSRAGARRARRPAR